jgi:hypothetical protein
MLDGTVVGLLLTGTLLHLTITFSPKGVTAPSDVGVDSLGRSRTQLMGGGRFALMELLPFVVGFVGPLALLCILSVVLLVRVSQI